MSQPSAHSLTDRQYVDRLKQLLQIDRVSDFDQLVRTAKFDGRRTIGELNRLYKSYRGSTILMDSVRHGCNNIVKYCISAGLDVNESDTHGETPLHFATAIGKEWPVTALMDNNAHLEPKDGNVTPLFVAVRTANAALVQLLLSAGAAPDGGRREGHYTPLQQALRLDQWNRSRVGIVKALLYAGADPNVGNFLPLESSLNMHLLPTFSSELLNAGAKLDLLPSHCIKTLEWRATTSDQAWGREEAMEKLRIIERYRTAASIPRSLEVHV